MQKVELNMKDKTATITPGFGWGSFTVVFMQSRFQNGNILAFYSDAPWGRATDSEQGWVVINPRTKTIVDMVESKTMWKSTGEFRAWRKAMTKKHGATKERYTARSYDGKKELKWKMTGL